MILVKITNLDLAMLDCARLKVFPKLSELRTLLLPYHIQPQPKVINKYKI